MQTWEERYYNLCRLLMDTMLIQVVTLLIDFESGTTRLRSATTDQSGASLIEAKP